MDREQLIEAVINALQVEEGEQIGLTTAQLCEKLEWSRWKVRRALLALRRQGRLDHAKVPITKINDEAGWVSAYYLKEDDGAIENQPTETATGADSGPES
jgi:DNA-binding FadR family transcriptional regulator